MLAGERLNHIGLEQVIWRLSSINAFTEGYCALFLVRLGTWADIRPPVARFGNFLVWEFSDLFMIPYLVCKVETRSSVWKKIIRSFIFSFSFILSEIEMKCFFFKFSVPSLFDRCVFIRSPVFIEHLITRCQVR
jgi:hypothetical protein